MDTGIDGDELLVLHHLRCVGAASIERIATGIGAQLMGDVEDAVLALARRGLLTRGVGPFGGWTLTARGRDADADATTRHLEAAGAAALLRSGYEVFLPLNREVLDSCSAWQLRRVDGRIEPNDHRDRAHDAAVVDRLTAADAAIAPVLDDAARALPWFAGYRPRLSLALDRVRAGELDQVADTFESFHMVWFELHEDLLATLGISRDDERRRTDGDAGHLR